MPLDGRSVSPHRTALARINSPGTTNAAYPTSLGPFMHLLLPEKAPANAETSILVRKLVMPAKSTLSMQQCIFKAEL